MLGTLLGATSYTALSFISSIAYKTTTYIASKTVLAIDYAIVQTIQSQVQRRMTQGIEHIGTPQETPQETNEFKEHENSPKRKLE